MNKQLANNSDSRNHRSFHVRLAGLVVAVSAFVGVSVASFDGPMSLDASTQAYPVWPVGPADMQVANRYGRIDHASLNSPDFLREPNPVPGVTIAAYETPPE